MIQGGALMDWTGCEFVERVPGRMSGVPVVIHSRVQADGVLENFDGGVSAEEIADLFDLEERSVRGVLEFAGRLKNVAA